MKDLALHPSISQEQLADSLLPARYQVMIRPSVRKTLIQKKNGMANKLAKENIGSSRHARHQCSVH